MPQVKVSDTGLWKLIQADNDIAFHELYDRYWERLFNTAHKVLHTEDVSKDVVQEVFIDLWNRRHKIHIHHVGAFLHQAVRFQVAKNIRMARLTPLQEECIDNTLSVNNTENQILWQDLDDAVVRSMNELPERCREIFRLSRYENLTHREIAE